MTTTRDESFDHDDRTGETAEDLASALLARGEDEFSEDEWARARGIYDQSARKRRCDAMRAAEAALAKL